MQIDEESVLQIIIRYLRDKGCYEALSSLLLEVNLPLSQELPKEFIYLQRLILQGRWDESERFLKPITDNYPPLVPKVSFLLLRQRFLEGLSWKSGGAQRWLMPPWRPAVEEDQSLEEVIGQLNQLKPYCTVQRTVVARLLPRLSSLAPLLPFGLLLTLVQQFNSLGMFLSIDKLEDHPEYGHWSCSEGRVRCLEELTTLLSAVLKLSPPPAHERVTLQQVIGMCLQQGQLQAHPEIVCHFLPAVGVFQKPSPLVDALAPPSAPVPVSVPVPVVPVHATADLRATVPWPQAPSPGIKVQAPVPAAVPQAAVPAVVVPAAKPVSWTVDEEIAVKQPPAGLLKRLVHDEPAAIPAPMPASLPVLPVPTAQVRQSKDKSSPHKITIQPAAVPQTVAGQAQRPASATRKSTAPAGPVAKSPHMLFQLPNCPLRCVAYLGYEGEHHRIAVGSNTKSVFVMSYGHFHEKTTGFQDVSDQVYQDAALEGVHTGSVYAMDWHAGSGLLVTGSNDKHLRISKPLAGQVCDALKGHNGTIRVVKFMATEPMLLSAGAGDFKPRLWDIEKKTCIRVLKEHPSTVHSLTWLSDSLAVSGCESGHLLAHDLRSGQPAWSFQLDRPAFALTSIQSMLAVGSSNGYVSLFDLHKQQVFSERQLHTEDVRSITAIGGDLLTSSYDHTGAVWRLPACSKQATLQGGHEDKILSSVHVSGADVITTGADGRVVLWK